MAEVNISKVQPGSILAGDVALPDGTLLLKAGTILGEREIAYLSKRDVRTVSVKDGPGGSMTTEVSPSIFAERCQRLDCIFAGVEGAPHMRALKEAARHRLRFRLPWE